MVQIGEIKSYRIGEIAAIAGVSRRTIDYYTNLGLLQPRRSESNYRYYTEQSLIRLKIIEGMKAGRFTLEEIKQHLNLLDQFVGQEPEQLNGGSVSIDLVCRQLRQLEKQLMQLQPAEAALDIKQTVQLKNKIMVQSMALLQSLMLCLNEITITL